jgi:hypothetical protein
MNLTQEEVQEVRELVKALHDAIENSICPTCKKQVVKRQVGRCVYGDCGHRLYQGRLIKSDHKKGFTTPKGAQQ